MDAAANKAIVSRIWEEIWNRGALDVVDAVIAPDYVGHIPAMPGPVLGAAAFKQMIVAYRTAYPDVHLTVDDLLADGDKVVARWTTRGTNTGSLMGMPATGRHIELPGISIFRIVNGQVVEEWEGFDSLGMMLQLGMAVRPAA
jgi:steroid delta-isomerase-like uncharacterized protein